MTKEIVTSFYKDLGKFNWEAFIPTDWTLTVYEKNDKLNKGEKTISNPYINIPNFGRCDYAFLLHIVDNYDELADVTIFTKINWHDQSTNLFELIQNAADYDFYDVGERIEHSVWYDSDTEPVPVNVKNHSHFVVYDVQSVKPYHIRHGYPAESIVDWYNDIFGHLDSLPVENIWSHGPCFSVSKKLIHRHPKSDYQYLLDKFHVELDLSNKVEFEKFESLGWHYHDNLLRFYRILFTFDVEPDVFKIHQN